MLKSQIPTKFVEAFGANAGAGYIRAVPVASQIGIVAGAASLNDGFPPLTATALASGGVPPAIQDFNGILNQMSAWDLWTAAAGITPYDATFQTAIGGYPNGAVVYTATTAVLGRVWVSTVDNNTTNPDTGGAGWLYLVLPADVPQVLNSRPKGSASYTAAGTFSWTAPTGVSLARFRLWAGGGGGGAGNSSNFGWGGGGGCYIEGYASVTPGTSYTVIIGAGGTSPGPGSNGTAGGSSAFSSFATANGGAGGPANQTGVGGTSVAYGGTGSIGAGVTAGFIYPGGNGGAPLGNWTAAFTPGGGAGSFGFMGGIAAAAQLGQAGAGFGAADAGGSAAGSTAQLGGSGITGALLLDWQT